MLVVVLVLAGVVVFGFAGCVLCVAVSSVSAPEATTAAPVAEPMGTSIAAAPSQGPASSPPPFAPATAAPSGASSMRIGPSRSGPLHIDERRE